MKLLDVDPVAPCVASVFLISVLFGLLTLVDKESLWADILSGAIMFSALPLFFYAVIVPLLWVLLAIAHFLGGEK